MSNIFALAAIEKRPHPIPFRTRKLSSSSPMILASSRWESRSLPGLLFKRSISKDMDLFYGPRRDFGALRRCGVTCCRGLWVWLLSPVIPSRRCLAGHPNFHRLGAGWRPTARSHAPKQQVALGRNQNLRCRGKKRGVRVVFFFDRPLKASCPIFHVRQGLPARFPQKKWGQTQEPLSEHRCQQTPVQFSADNDLVIRHASWRTCGGQSAMQLMLLRRNAVTSPALPQRGGQDFLVRYLRLLSCRKGRGRFGNKRGNRAR